MKQVLHRLNDGSTEVAEVPVPSVPGGQVLIRTTKSLVSAGTERMLVEFGRAGWLARARQQPDKVREVIEKARTDGVAATFDAVRSKLDQPLALGYCNVGRVVQVGDGVRGFSLGDRVLSNGPHAELVTVPTNLCAAIPPEVEDEAAAFAVLGAIGLQGIRLAQPTLGERVVVTGLGLIGLLVVQLLRAQGCRVLGIDFDDYRLALAQRFGAEVISPASGQDVLRAAAKFSAGAGVDAVIVTASTSSSDPISQAARMCRKRGRIVLVGVTGLELNRADFYEKELTFQVSCSYGPGRYDRAYEEMGLDYPIGYVRWTEQRNFEAVLHLMAIGAIDVAPLVSLRVPVDRAAEAFEELSGASSPLGIVLEYPDAAEAKADEPRRLTLAPSPMRAGRPAIAVLGAGNHASRVLIPALKAQGAALRTLVSGRGVSAAHFGRRFGFAEASTDADAAIADPESDTVVIATRHNLHAGQVLQALRAGKHVFCEKPLCLTLSELRAIEQEARDRPSQHLMVGYNRRFAPHVVLARRLLDGMGGPKTFIMTVNAGELPEDHWTQDRSIGGGRIIGEACHFIDLLRHLAQAPIVGMTATALEGASAGGSMSIALRFADGSVGTVHYLANGHRGFPKERLEVFCPGRVLQIDNFRRMRGWGWGKSARLNLWRQDKGAGACAGAFVTAVRDGGSPPIPLDEIVEVARVSIEAADHRC